MANYKQQKSIKRPLLQGSLMEQKKFAKDFYKEFIQGTTVKNISTGLEIKFTSEGLGKLMSKTNGINLSALCSIQKMLELAEYNNFGQRKPTDKSNVIGYLNFKCKAEIGSKMYNFRIAVKLKTDMKAYYYHGFNRIKK